VNWAAHLFSPNWQGGQGRDPPTKPEELRVDALQRCTISNAPHIARTSPPVGRSFGGIEYLDNKGSTVVGFGFFGARFSSQRSRARNPREALQGPTESWLA
jgi:hypothetical protein